MLMDMQDILEQCGKINKIGAKIKWEIKYKMQLIEH